MILRIVVAALLLFARVPAFAQTPEDAAANRLFVEAVQLWNRAQSEPLAERSLTLQRVKSNLKAIIERHGGSALAVRLVIGETVGPLSIARVELAEAEAEGARAIGQAQTRAARAAGVERIFRDCRECPEMVFIPTGTTRLASGYSVTIAVPFAVGKFEVTFAEWDACFAVGGCSHWPDDNGWGRGQQPVIDVSWHDAQEYVGWLSKRTGKAYRLPSVVEWEYAAQAATGSEAVAHEGANHSNCVGCGSRWDRKQPALVGSFVANAFGLHDMLGNVAEWVSDCAKNPFVSFDKQERECAWGIPMGGSWILPLRSARSGHVDQWDDKNGRRIFSGFRVARSL